MKIRQKLISGFVVISLMLGLVGILGLYANSNIVSSYEEGDKHFDSILEASNEVSSYAKRVQGHTMLFLTLHNTSDRDKAYQRIASLQEQINILDSEIMHPEAKDILDKTTSRTEELRLTIGLLFKAYDNDIQTSGTFDPRNHEELIRKLDNISSIIRQNGLDLAKIEMYIQEGYDAEAKQRASYFYVMIFVIGGFAIVICATIGLIFEKSVSKPIKDLKDAFTKIRSGNFDIRIETKSDDEIAELLNEFNSMAHDLKTSTEKVAKSLEEREVLLREIHHRVKNNMQVVSSLLGIQSNSITDEKFKAIFMDSQNRVYAMALIHEKLCQSDNLAQIDLKDYIGDVVSNISGTYGQKGNIKFDIDIGQIPIKIDYAVPCGLIINEIITNSFKYAFPDGRQGIIKIRAKLNGDDNNTVKLSIGDNGIGIAKDVDVRNTKSLGLKLITSLTEGQLHGNIVINRENGTEFQISFRQEKL